MRSIRRVADLSFNTVAKLLVDAGRACAAFHDETARGVESRRVQIAGILKAKNVPNAKAEPDGAGDVWTWTALDADSKLPVTWHVGGRDSEALMDDLARRLVATRPTSKRSRARSALISTTRCW